MKVIIVEGWKLELYRRELKRGRGEGLELVIREFFLRSFVF